MFTTRQKNNNVSLNSITYNENYFTSRKKILNDYLKDEESENKKYIEETENFVSSTKLFLKDLFSSELDFDTLNDELEDIQTELETDSNLMKNELDSLNIIEQNVEKQLHDTQKEEENNIRDFNKKMSNLKNDLESKEFTIQNMERLYIELENVIKNNIQKGNEQLLTMEQFNDFLSQNAALKQEIIDKEKLKEKLDNQYIKLLKRNTDLIAKRLGNIDVGDDDALKSKKNQNEQLYSSIMKSIKFLKGLNVENDKFENELYDIEELIGKTSSKSLFKNKSYDNIFEE